MSLGGGTTTTTEQSQTSYPQWTQDAQANTFSVGRGQIENFLRNPQYSVAGFQTDTLKGMDLARGTAQDVFTAPRLQAPGSPNLQAAYGTAAQVTPGAISEQMNPYLRNVGDTTLDAMRREYMNADAGLASKYAAGSMMGGSGEAIARGQAARGYGQNVASTIAQIQSAGYDKATATAMANAQMQQQTGMANQSAENTMRMTGADYGLKSAQVNDALRNTQLAREQAAAQGLTQNGLMQQQQSQQVLDVPWTALERLFGITPKQMNSQTFSQKESPDTSASPLQSILGLGSTILGAKTAGGGSVAASLLGLSDEREKTDIQKLGKDPETGLQLYSYRYKGDPKTYPKMTGPMAQDVEDAYPGSTRNVGGRMAVPLDMLMNAGKKKAA
ncbi:tail fiber domain-containing protein [Bosea sp. (in: a-proteobacteria)]|uniref:tail fiber domain-containing protein n=1 Tax=Bosea sp. (in: a-proteobacteria) TaxID=1871050 RepID=UPI002B4949C1|nr:tail fiber domain-containing protein [Bosea sp. (in: a-proteobacteria)]WRH56691.1 MAG: tail fiber domain-containing protein [Bosea sp. (in: a-proteobacteria)]